LSRENVPSLNASDAASMSFARALLA